MKTFVQLFVLCVICTVVLGQDTVFLGGKCSTGNDMLYDGSGRTCNAYCKALGYRYGDCVIVDSYGDCSCIYNSD